MNIRNRARILIVASTFAAGVSLLPAAIQLVSAEGVNQTGPTGGQCNLKGMDGDFVDPGASDTTNNANITLSGLSGAPAMTVAGCGFNIVMPPLPPPTPTPVPTPRPVRAVVLSNAVRSALAP